ncbi:MAG: 1-deoxy-D-xylulose-5-phosphate synthase [Clostridia bacterium]|nr:1-deoxy-D-xylulose-5-phosphate synthase [Clostridia bacterium]
MKGKYLPDINCPDDVKAIPEEELSLLAEEIREELISTVSKTGGHLASNLGVVELTIALHRVFSSPEDKIIWDVSHQSYTHKLFTGRGKKFNTLRQPDGISGFSRRKESEHDIFSGGHSSVALSAAYGIAAANKLDGNKNYVVAVIGDGAFTGGMVYEALNNAGRAGTGTKLIVVLNDNEMSISPNVGSLARYFAQMKATPRYVRFKSHTEKVLTHIPLIGKPLVKGIYNTKTFIKNIIYNSTMFEDLGFRYMGPVDGHNISMLTSALEGAKEVDSPVVLHINTVKGKGYEYAEKAPDAFHGISAFDLNSGEPVFSEPSFSDAFGKYLVSAAEKDSRICAITAAMSLGCGLEEFKARFENRFYDVGIAEQHAVTFAAGLARGGMLPVFAVYSSFLQRAYDQIIHDCAMQGLKIVFGIDRAGFVGADGESHHGVFDAAFINTIPDITVFAPTTFKELELAFNKALYGCDGPVAVRYPRGVDIELPYDFNSSFGDFDIYGDSSEKIAIVTYGRCFGEACKALKMLKEKNINAFIVKLNTIKPVSNLAVKEVLHCEKVFFFEEGQRFGGIGETFGDKLFKFDYNGVYRNIAVEGEFPMQNTVKGLMKHYYLDGEGIFTKISEECEKNG